MSEVAKERQKCTCQRCQNVTNYKDVCRIPAQPLRPHTLPATALCHFQLYASELQIQRNRHNTYVRLHDDWRRLTDEFLELLLHPLFPIPLLEEALMKVLEDCSINYNPTNLFNTPPDKQLPPIHRDRYILNQPLTTTLEHRHGPMLPTK